MSNQNEATNTATADSQQTKDSSYDLFILALTLLSIFTIVIMVLPVNAAAKDVVYFVDTLICFVFLFDFLRSIIKAPHKLEYLKWGWMDFLGSLPALPILRVFRLWRFVRAVRILRRTSLKELWYTFIKQPADSSLMTMTLAGIVLLGSSSYFILLAELPAPEANITTATDAIWWSMVSVTTVGYGDRFPVTFHGRMVAIFLMVGGIGLFSVLTSFLSNAFIGAGDDEQQAELRQIRQELAEIRQMLQELSRNSPEPT